LFFSSILLYVLLSKTLVYSNAPSLPPSNVVMGINNTMGISDTLPEGSGRCPLYARHPILHRIALDAQFVVASIQIAGFTTFGRLATISLCHDA